MKLPFRKQSSIDSSTPTVVPQTLILHDARPPERPDGGSCREDDAPWAERIGGARLLNELAETVTRHVVLRSHHFADAVALWIVHTYAISVWSLSPILGITSPEKRCGKSTLLMLLNALCRRAILASNVTPASIFRLIDRDEPTLLVDEADTFLEKHDELRGIFNAGHTRTTAYVMRCTGENHEPRNFSTFAPKAIAKIGDLPSTMTDRAILIEMMRRKTSEWVHKLRMDRVFEEMEPLRKRITRWVAENEAMLAAADPHVPTELHDRAQDNWRPLLAIADSAGGEWPARARHAAISLSSHNDEEDSSLGVQLLRDIRIVFDERRLNRLSSEQLVAALTKMEDRPWVDVGYGRPLSQRSLARLLDQFHIRPAKVRFGSDSMRGYDRGWFEDAFARYLTQATDAVPEPFQVIKA